MQLLQKQVGQLNNRMAYLGVQTSNNLLRFYFYRSAAHQLNEFNDLVEVGDLLVLVGMELSVLLFSCVQPYIKNTLPFPNPVFLHV